jgi:hypothetical protein
MFGLATRSDDIIFFPGEIFDARELTRQFKRLFEMVEITRKCLGIDARNVLGPEYVGKTLLVVYPSAADNSDGSKTR